MPNTKQGVRDLNKLGPKRNFRLRARPQTCPPHLPGEWKTNEFGKELRCRSCNTLLDEYTFDLYG